MYAKLIAEICQFRKLEQIYLTINQGIVPEPKCSLIRKSGLVLWGVGRIFLTTCPNKWLFNKGNHDHMIVKEPHPKLIYAEIPSEEKLRL